MKNLPVIKQIRDFMTVSFVLVGLVFLLIYALFSDKEDWVVDQKVIDEDRMLRM